MVIKNLWRERHPEKHKAYLERTKNARKKHMRDYRLSRYHPCLDCGILVTHESIRCRSCALKMRIQNGEMTPNKGKKGDQSFTWKGGRIQNTAGYIMIYQPKHPRATNGAYVLEHILIWEQIHGKPVPKDWVIHHLNGIRNDNRPSNLVALPARKHNLIINTLKKRIQELEALLNNQRQLL